MVESYPAKLQHLLRDCVVRISGSGLLGTGFFVAPDLLVTCAHVVKKTRQGETLQLTWNKTKLRGRLIKKVPDPYTDGSFPDVALIELIETGTEHPCVLLDDGNTYEARHPLYAWGYTLKNPFGESIIPMIEGEARRADSPDAWLIKFRAAQIAGGMSGSPLLDDTTKRVCGMIKLSRAEDADLGGYAIRADAILKAFPQLAKLQENYHRRHNEWARSASAVTDSNLRSTQRRGGPPDLSDDPRPKDGLSSSKLGSIHVHIDGEGKEVARSVLRRLGHFDDSEFVTILESFGGPQREEKERLYELHTPGEDNTFEQLNFFSTTVLYDGPSLPTDLDRARIEGSVHRLLAEVRAFGQKGVVVEAERVVGRIGEEETWADSVSAEPFFADGFGFEKASYDPCYEIHLSVDIDRKSGTQQTLRLSDLDDECIKRKIPIGGWFLFDHPEKWAYRSNMFTGEVSRENIVRYRNELVAYLKTFNDERADGRVRVLVEESLGVWKAPFKKAHPFLTVPEMAQWEKQTPSEFWVVAGNFLGDQDERVREAMQSNLRGGTRYVYFLRSFADYQRWLKFRGALGEKMRMPLEALMSAYRVEVKWSNDREREDCFIAWPKNEQRQDVVDSSSHNNYSGYELIRDELTKQVLYGREMSTSQVKDMVTLLAPTLLTHNAAKIVSFLDPPPVTKFAATAVAIMQTSLFDDWEQYAKLKQKYAAMFDKYDSSMATELSKLGAIVVFSTEGGYLIVYKCGGDDHRAIDESRVVDNAIHGTRTMIRLLNNALHEIGHPEPEKTFKAVIDYGSIERSIRSGGFHYAGEPVDHCRLLIRRMKYGQLCITAKAMERARRDVVPGEEAPVEIDSNGNLPKAFCLPRE